MEIKFKKKQYYDLIVIQLSKEQYLIKDITGYELVDRVELARLIREERLKTLWKN